jgi:N-methylhydantoinase A
VARKGRRRVIFPEAPEGMETNVFDHYALPPGFTTDGPAVFEENESTFVVGPGAHVSLLPDGSLLAEMPEDAA